MNRFLYDLCLHAAHRDAPYQGLTPYGLDWAQKHDIHLEFIEPGRPMQNGFIERFNRSYRQGVLDMYVFKSLQEVKERTELWMNDYNEQCPHDSLNGMTPVEYRLFHQPQNSSNTWH